MRKLRETIKSLRESYRQAFENADPSVEFDRLYEMAIKQKEKEKKWFEETLKIKKVTEKVEGCKAKKCRLKEMIKQRIHFGDFFSCQPTIKEDK